MQIHTDNPPSLQSPLSSVPAQKVRDLPREFLLERLELYYGDRPPREAVESSYSLWECAETGLQFAWPMLPGSACFYRWVSGFSSYYPGQRWEYGRTQVLIQEENCGNGEFRLLDIGCGKGDFLRSLTYLSTQQRFGLDLNEPAVAACRSHGFCVFCGTIESALRAEAFKPGGFNVLTCFHCLEHVDNPVEFARSLITATAPGGRVFISTPFSPMSFEADWFDIMNHPPHHLTRWNLTAYRRLADMLGVKMRFFVPPSDPVQRTLGEFRLLLHGPNRPVTRGTLLTDLLRHAPKAIRLFRRQMGRGRNNQGVSADVILIEFRVP